ncbi:uncharacterized protein BO95DRAFT_429939 [Aspergillus brunneoviolaceus CBS 621.78]|uniref:Uncharacterized protein n=1 Tax=Aspergillus brunneoviolaceus CBS 621.78 TaxID=1450534 RepID=A0ACD1GFJ8_9EURO|nr:hypothetical protein BO95DRAFT_429939 [Aspergillus brunneoviolaceus CBS 621.78]RAH47899.1 hypothetical protein BO95DRAFT_429939 [Aspergillus brunneoviolaceus CBS 621.78]
MSKQTISPGNLGSGADMRAERTTSAGPSDRPSSFRSAAAGACARSRSHINLLYPSPSDGTDSTTTSCSPRSCILHRGSQILGLAKYLWMNSGCKGQETAGYNLQDNHKPQPAMVRVPVSSIEESEGSEESQAMCFLDPSTDIPRRGKTTAFSEVGYAEVQCAAQRKGFRLACGGRRPGMIPRCSVQRMLVQGLVWVGTRNQELMGDGSTLPAQLPRVAIHGNSLVDGPWESACKETLSEQLAKERAGSQRGHSTDFMEHEAWIGGASVDSLEVKQGLLIVLR